MVRFGNVGEFVALVFVMVAVPSACGFAAWSENGNPVCTATGYQESPQIVSDGAGGAIITWQDRRSGNNDIYVQRVDALGVAKWGLDGVALCTAGNDQQYPQIASDGAGGAIITWQDGRTGNNHIYAQRVDALGVVKWSFDGVAIYTATGYQEYPQIVSDGAGGAIITWNDYRSGTDYDVYAQRVDALGVVKWSANGVAICTAMNDQQYPQIASDGAGGAIITWEDYRSDSYSDIYAQRVDALGIVKWGANEVAICAATDYQEHPRIVSDGAGGAIITWDDYRSGSYSDIYAQRADELGAVKWGLDGVTICTAGDDQQYPQIASDGAGGAIITWHDYRSGNNDIYARRVDMLGMVKWSVDGVAICTAANYQQYPQIVSDGAGGAIITWYDYRSGDNDIYARGVDALGVVKWSPNGVPMCTATGDQQYPQIVSNGASGAIVTWEDYRGGGSDIYAQRVKADGTINLLFASASATAEGDHVDISWRVTANVPGSSFLIKRSQAQNAGFVTLDVPIRKETGSSFSCTDYSVLPGHTYWYQIVLASPAGDEVYGPIEVHVGGAPTAYRAYQSYPNPFNPVCTIRYDIPSAGRVSLQIFDVSGSLVRTLVNSWREPGVYSEVWDGRTDGGTALSSGVYFYQLKAGDFVATGKTVLLR